MLHKYLTLAEITRHDIPNHTITQANEKLKKVEREYPSLYHYIKVEVAHGELTIEVEALQRVYNLVTKGSSYCLVPETVLTLEF